MQAESAFAALDAGLAKALGPPRLPPDLRARVMAAVAREPAIDWQRSQVELVREHRAALAQLNRTYLRRCRDAILAGALLFLMIGSTVRPLAHWLTPFFASAAPGVAGALALGTGLLLGLIAARDLVGGPASVTAP